MSARVYECASLFRGERECAVAAIVFVLLSVR